MGRPRAVAWDVIEVCEFTWRDNCVFEMTERQADGALVRVKEMIIEDMTAPASIHAFGSTQLVYYTEAPLRIDTAACDVDGVVHVEVSEVEMLRGVAARATSRAETSTDDFDWTPYGRSLVSSTPNGTTADTAAEGIHDFDCVVEAHQMLPMGLAVPQRDVPRGPRLDPG